MTNTILRRCIHWLWLCAAICALPLIRGETSALDAVGKSAGDWLKVRAETARLETEWNTQRQLLDSLVHGLEERAQSLEIKRDYLRAKTAKDRDDLAALESSNQTASAGLNSVEERLKAITARLLLLRAAMPPRLSEALDLSYKSLASTELTVGEHMQLTMTVLNRCLQFNRSIICEDQILTLDGDRQARQFEVIYWGLSHGYALDRPAGKVWFGSPGTAGWQWEPMPNAADRVGKLIAIYRGKGEPEFVEVPAGLKNQGVAAAKK